MGYAKVRITQAKKEFDEETQLLLGPWYGVLSMTWTLGSIWNLMFRGVTTEDR